MAAPWEDFQNDPQGPWNDFVVQKADPKIGQPEDLTFAEKYVAPVLEKLGVGDVAGGNLRGSAVGGAFQGAADPGIAVAQIAGNLIGQGDTVNKAVSDEEQQYQQARKSAGRSGVDLARVAGNIAVTAPLAGMGTPAETALGVAGKGGVSGAGFGVLQPVTDTSNDSFLKQKLKQAAIGAVTGAGTAAAGSALARVVSPNASTNADVALLRSEGVQPTIGQTLGGAANAMEEKAQSIPILGDAIAAARGASRASFNNAAINRSLAPIGESVQGSGQNAIAQAGDRLSKAYGDALQGVNHVNFDTPEFNQALGQLQDMATGLKPELAAKFDKTLTNVVLRKMSPNGSILGSDLKAVDSELGKMASKWQGSSVASESEFGDAIRQLQANLMDQVKRSYPQAADAIDAADAGWANLVRVEKAGAAAVNHGGTFTPAQLGNAVKAADQSERDRATARGTALMQDLVNAGNNVIGNKVADSGTVGRALMASLGLGSALVSPAIPAGLVGASALYLRPVQNALVRLVADRPEAAPAVANYLRQLVLPATTGTVPLIGQYAQGAR